jgi:hypothetical protein
MFRECAHCHRSFTPQDFVKDESKGMEADRRALGLEGVRFLYYVCPQCRYADIFVDIHALPGESAEDFQARRAGLEEAVRQIHAEKVEVVISDRI